MHIHFCKRSLNMSKFCSNSAIYTELGVFPIEHQALSLTIKYWLRLVNITENKLLNECFKEAENENFEWIQGVKAVMNMNGFGNVWLNPKSVHPDHFHKTFKRRLNDQFVQNLTGKIASSSRFETLHFLTSGRSQLTRSSYIDQIRSSDVREIYTRLRIDMHNLESSLKNINNSSDGKCKNCSADIKETPEHFLLNCGKFISQREQFYEKISNLDVQFNSMTNTCRLKYILDLKCPDECINICCKYVIILYKTREKIDNEPSDEQVRN